MINLLAFTFGEGGTRSVTKGDSWRKLFLLYSGGVNPSPTIDFVYFVRSTVMCVIFAQIYLHKIYKIFHKIWREIFYTAQQKCYTKIMKNKVEEQDYLIDFQFIKQPKLIRDVYLYQIVLFL